MDLNKHVIIQTLIITILKKIKLPVVFLYNLILFLYILCIWTTKNLKSLTSCYIVVIILKNK